MTVGDIRNAISGYKDTDELVVETYLDIIKGGYHISDISCSFNDDQTPFCIFHIGPNSERLY